MICTRNSTSTNETKLLLRNLYCTTFYVYVVIEFLYLPKTSYKYFTFKQNVNETNEMQKQNNGDRMCNLPVNELENKGTSEEKTNCKLVSGRVEITELRN